MKLGRLRARKIGRRTIIPADNAESWFHRLPHMKTTNRQGAGVMTATSTAINGADILSDPLDEVVENITAGADIDSGLDRP